LNKPPDATSGIDEPDAWAPLRALTAARIGLARTGASLATQPLLDFRLAHARARDAVHAALDEQRLLAELRALGLPAIMVSSAVKDRAQYLLRPDLGRVLAISDEPQLASHGQTRHDVAFVITDGLSARAVQAHAQPLLAQVLPALDGAGWRIAPLALVRLGRVAIGDSVARALAADSVCVLIGERPGLTAPDSMGAYLTWQPGPHTVDAERNCISNIRPQGIGYIDAAATLVQLLKAMRTQRLSGVALKDTTIRIDR
jgi:ethanolamine ammonia-lyase small subunit